MYYMFSFATSGMCWPLNGCVFIIKTDYSDIGSLFLSQTFTYLENLPVSVVPRLTKVILGQVTNWDYSHWLNIIAQTIQILKLDSNFKIFHIETEIIKSRMNIFKKLGTKHIFLWIMLISAIRELHCNNIPYK